ncbi:MAG: head fiber protein, partial [Acinetobacter sp.]
GGVKKMANQADTTATDVAGLVTDFNALLAKLKAAGMM